MHSKGRHIEPAKGRLGVLLVGLGAVSTTFIAGIAAVKKGLAKPFGSLAQMGTIRLGKRTGRNVPMIKDFVALSGLKDLYFGAWDPIPDDAHQAALKAGVLEQTLVSSVKDELKAIRPWKAVFDSKYVTRISGTNVKKGKSKLELAEQLKDDIEKFRKQHKLDRMVMIWCGSTEIFLEPEDVHSTPEKLEKAMKQNHDSIPSSMVYAYAAITAGIPFANGAPNLTVDVPAMMTLAKKHGVPICGKDFKTGQTLMKTILAPGLKARLLGLHGWFSTNILGNRDGEVLDDPMSFKTKEESKLSVLDQILQPDLYPDLYKNFYHKVRINYYPPRGDNKEGWDNLDIFGWLGYPMQIKIDFLCRDSILAAPLVLDLILFLDLARRAGMSGIQEWLSFYFKSPMCAPELYPEHDLFIQLMKLKNTLRFLRGEDQITHLGLDYYE
ncbi:MAG TPA: inositol-3-phosphate synthase [Acidobacteriota bacterium]|jgi:myo-inositol-1-phosphate synthase|nr:inositol-3-phosphate synthase [Acidobacteriota bacterium]